MNEFRRTVWKMNEHLATGDIAGMVYAGINTDGECLTGYCLKQKNGNDHGSIFELLGALEIVKARLLSNLDFGDEYEEDDD